MHNDRALALVARLLMAIIFLLAGSGKALHFAATVGAFAKLGIPLPEVVAALAICIEVGGGILLVIGYRVVIVAAVMAAFTLGAALIAHQFWNAEGAAQMQQMNNFLKNVAMVGGFLMVIVDARQGRSR